MTVRRLVSTLGIGFGLGLGLAPAACGDNLHRPGDDPFTAVSGARLALQKYRYDDGTELAVSGEFYDTELHTRCAPQPWRDGALRCAPVADDAEYADPGCTMPIGLARTIAKPTYFVAPDTAAGGAVATRVFRAGAAATRIAAYYTRTGGACAGPTAVPPQLTSFFEVGDELDGDALVAFHDTEIADGRLGLVIRASDDGLRVAAGLRDRQLDAACAAAPQGDGSVACEPTGAAAAVLFGDPACAQPVVMATAAGVPAIAKLTEPSGCASYHSVGDELSAPVYRKTGSACAPAEAPPGGRLFAVGPAIEPAALGRTQDDVAGHRLHRVVLAAGSLRLFDDRLFDTALAADCRPRTLRGVIRCVPVAVTTASLVFHDDACTAPVQVAEVPQHACEPATYATTSRPLQVRPIGDLAPGPLFRLDGTTCAPYAGAPGNELRALGPPIDPATFLGAIYYGERSP